MPDRFHDAVDILRPLQEAQALGEGELAHDVKGKHLQPGAQVADSSSLHEQFVELGEEEGNGRVDVGLKGQEIAHGVEA